MKRIFHGRKYDATVRLLDGEEFNTEVTVHTAWPNFFDQFEFYSRVHFL